MAFIDGKEILFSSEITGGGTEVTVNGEKVDTFNADTKLDKKGVSIEEHAGFLYVYKLDENGERTGQYVRLRGDIFEAFFKSDTAQVQGQYTINGAELYRKEFDENGNVIKSYNTKYHKDCIEGNNEDGNYFKLKLPRAAGTRTIATTNDVSTQISNLQKSINSNITALRNGLTNVTNDLEDHTARLGNWYSAETMAAGIYATMGRMYLFTGSGIKLLNADGSEIFATDGNVITESECKALALILPNVEASNGGGYRCKAIWATSNLFSISSFEHKDFLLDVNTEKVKIIASGGTSMWSI